MHHSSSSAPWLISLIDSSIMQPCLFDSIADTMVSDGAVLADGVPITQSHSLFAVVDAARLQDAFSGLVVTRSPAKQSASPASPHKRLSTGAHGKAARGSPTLVLTSSAVARKNSNVSPGSPKTRRIQTRKLSLQSRDSPLSADRIMGVVLRRRSRDSSKLLDTPASNTSKHLSHDINWLQEESRSQAIEAAPNAEVRPVIPKSGSSLAERVALHRNSASWTSAAPILPPVLVPTGTEQSSNVPDDIDLLLAEGLSGQTAEPVEVPVVTLTSNSISHIVPTTGTPLAVAVVDDTAGKEEVYATGTQADKSTELQDAPCRGERLDRGDDVPKNLASSETGQKSSRPSSSGRPKSEPRMLVTQRVSDIDIAPDASASVVCFLKGHSVHYHWIFQDFPDSTASGATTAILVSESSGHSGSITSMVRCRPSMT